MQIPTLVAVLISAVEYNKGRANYTCFKLTSPEAEKVESVYDDNQDSGVFWSLSTSGLGPCDFSSIYCSSKSSVCIDSGTIIVVLYNLTSSVNLKVEGPGKPISYKEIDCPQPPTPERPQPTTPDNKPGEQRGRTGIVVSLAFIAALLFIIIKVVRECRKSQMAPVKAANGSAAPC